MTRYLAQLRDQVFVKGFRFLFFAKIMGKKICKNISNGLNSKYRQKLLDHAQQSVTDTLKTELRKAIQKAERTTGDLIDYKVAEKITKVSKTLPQNNLEIVESETEILKERYISPEKRQKIIDDLRLA